MMKWKFAQALEIRWWKQYLSQKPVDQYLHDKKSYWRRVLKECDLKSAQVQGEVLDAGCGPAGIFTIFDQQNVTAIDPLLETYNKELSHFKKGWYPNVNFQTLALEEMDFREMFDYVFCLNAINHVHDIELAPDKLVAAAKKGSTLVLSIDAHNYNMLKWLFRLIPGDVLHPHQYDLKEYRSMLSKRGCTITHEYL